MIFQWFTAAALCEGATCTLPIPETLPDGDYVWYMEVWGPDGYDRWVVNGAAPFSVDTAGDQ